MKKLSIKISLIILQLSVISCGGGSAGCSVAVGGLTCASSNSNNSNASVTSTSIFSTIHSMDLAIGAKPTSSLIEVNGVLYGTTQSGGSGYGTVYSIPSSGIANSATIIHEFLGGTDGQAPTSELTLGSDGNLYGTTSNGGTLNGGSGYGTVYQIKLTGGIATYVWLYSFSEEIGTIPYGGLIQGADSALYGTTYGDGINNQGTVYKISTKGEPTKIYTFNGGANGGNPQFSLIQDSAGIMYGTTTSGGNYGNGTVFSITVTGTYTKIADLSTPPNGSLLLASDGNLYGTVSTGYPTYVGYVFKTGTNADSNFTEFLQNSSSGPSGPVGKLVEIKGVIYGTSQFGGSNVCITGGCGTIFSLTTNSSNNYLADVVDFSANLPINGYNPTTGLVLGGDGYYYGTTSNGGGTTSLGTIYKFYP